MQSIDVDKARLRRWLEIHGGEITRNRLRRYRPGRERWLPVEIALRELIAAGEIIEYRDELEPLKRGNGFAATRYKLATNGASA